MTTALRARRLRLVEDRVERYVSEREPAVVLDPDAVEEADELLRAVGWDIETGGAELDVEAVLAVAWLYWFRATAETPERSDAELAVAILLFTPLLDVRPELVPGELREAFADIEAAAVAASAPTEVAWAVEVVGASRASAEPADAVRRTFAVVDRAAGMADHGRYLESGDPAHLDRAIAAVRAANGAPANLTVLLRERFLLAGDPVDIRDAVASGRRAVLAAGADRGPALSNLATALLTRFDAFGRRLDLEEAVRLLREATTGTPVPAHLTNLASALLSRHELFGEPGDLDDAVTAARVAADTADAAADAERVSALSLLGLALRTRHDRTGSTTDLEDVVSVLRDAVATADDSALPRLRADLDDALRTRYERLGSVADLDDAIAAARASVDDTPLDTPAMAGRWNDLGHLLLHRARLHHLTATPPHGELDDLHDAVAAMIAAVEHSEPDSPERATLCSNLAVALLAAHHGAGAARDLAEAAVWAREAVAQTADDQPDRALHLVNLALALAAAPGGVDEALACLHTASAGAPSPLLRLFAARWLGRTAADAAYPQDAEHGFATAVGLLGAASWHGLGRRSREAHIAAAGSLAHDAAAWSIHNGNPARAVELLETARHTLWNQLTGTTPDLATLTATAPDLATGLTTLNRLPPDHLTLS